VRTRIAFGLVAVAVLVLGTAALWGSDYLLLIGFEVCQLAALAQAWSLLAGYGGVVSLAVSAFVGIGSYATAKTSEAMGFGLATSLVAAAVVAGVFALAVSVPMFRFRGLYFTVASLVLAQALSIFMSNSSLFGGNQGVLLAGTAPTAAGIYLLSFAIALAATGITFWAGRSKLGLGLRAIRDDEDVAGRMGVPAFRVKLAGFVAGAVIMGLVGGVQAVRIGYVEPGAAFNFNWTIETVNAAIVGGAGTVAGPLVGAGISVLLSQSLGGYAQLHLVITGLVLILVIRLAPAGVTGLAARLLARRRPAAKPVPVAATTGAPPGQRLAPGEPLLAVRDVAKRYGGVPAVDGVSLEVRSGEVLGIVGPNGAGKSTLIGLLSGALSGEGTVVYLGEDITGVGAGLRARRGIGRTHQVPRPFEGLTVLENLLVARRYGRGSGQAEAVAECTAILLRCGLAEAAQTPASELGLLRLKRLELARALALRPRVLLLDEIGAGLVETELNELIDLITQLRAEVEAIVVVEHVMDLIRRCCDRLVVVDRGRLLLEDTPEAALADPRVAAVYLGTAAADGTPPPDRGSRAFDRPLLELRGVSARYGHHRAIDGVDLTVGRGEIVALLGANGAGKTTVARTISGTLPISGGEIRFDGARVDGRPPHELVRLGIAHCMEGRRIFADLTVRENLLLGGRGATKPERRRRLVKIYDLFPDLLERSGNSGAGLSGGQQQMLAIGRALMSAPALVVFDEISLGLAPITVDRLYDALQEINADGVSMIVIEQNVERGLALADRVAVLEKGSVALAGRPAEIRADDKLRALYVGQAAS
jgi:ABC-type branched-subunit amino acid transport system ATPase component/ABC-type branched-subunit amino acid transport system permease subunit